MTLKLVCSLFLATPLPRELSEFLPSQSWTKVDFGMDLFPWNGNRRRGEKSSFAAVSVSSGCEAPREPLETDGRTEADSQVVLGTVVEVNFVPGLETQPEWSPEALDTASGIQSYLRVTGGNCSQ
jgi:hypothetical protein